MDENRVKEEKVMEGNLDWDGLKPSQLKVAMTALLCGLFFSVMDGTVCNVALPALARDLMIDESDSIWIVNSFQLIIVMLLLPCAALGELIGHRKIYLYGLFIFTVGSLCCALSDSFRLLVLSRTLQGIGAALEMSVSTSLVKLIYPKKQLGKGVALNATIVALAMVIGPVFTGAVLSWASWPWLFIVNVPFGLAAFVIAYRSLPANPIKVRGRKFDVKEALLNALSFGLFIGCIEAVSHGARAWMVGIGGLLCVVVVTLFLRNQLKKEFPMLPLDLMKNPVFSVSVATSIVSFTSQMLVLVGMPFVLTHQFNYDAGQIGMVMTAYPIIILLVAPLAGFLINRIHPLLLSCTGLVILCASNFLLALMPTDSSFMQIGWLLALSGAGFGFFQSPNNHLMLSSAPTYRAGGASGMLAVARLTGQTLGAACVALFFQLFDYNGPVMAMYFGGVLTLIAMVVTLFVYRRHSGRYRA